MPRKRKTGKIAEPDKGGQDTKRTAEVQKALLEALMVGHTDKDAMILAGVGKTFFYTWIREDAEFATNVEKARLKSKDQSLKSVRTASMKTWQAAAWYLERRFGSEYAQRQVYKHETPIPVDLSEAAAKRLAKYNPGHAKA